MMRKIRVLVGKPGLDGHDRGAKVIAKALRDAGMEVIYTGLHQTPQMIVQAAIDEDVDVIGLSILSGAHLEVAKEIMDLLKKEQVDKDKMVLIGGVIPESDHQGLRDLGIKEIFTPGASLEKMVNFIQQNIKIA